MVQDMILEVAPKKLRREGEFHNIMKGGTSARRNNKNWK